MLIHAALSGFLKAMERGIAGLTEMSYQVLTTLVGVFRVVAF